jgi:hypothetical protein
MTLNQNIISLILTSGLMAIMITSCGPRVQKPDDAFDLVKKERMLTNDSNFVSKEIIQESMKTAVVVKKTETQDEWTKFRIDTEKKIRLNEIQIKKITDLPDVNASLRRKLTKLENDNSSLKSRLDEYNEEVKAKWEMFKASMNHNVNQIGIELNALKTNQKE